MHIPTSGLYVQYIYTYTEPIGVLNREVSLIQVYPYVYTILPADSSVATCLVSKKSWVQIPPEATHYSLKVGCLRCPE